MRPGWRTFESIRQPLLCCHGGMSHPIYDIYAFFKRLLVLEAIFHPRHGIGYAVLARDHKPLRYDLLCLGNAPIIKEWNRNPNHTPLRTASSC
jgi:hypothetical protein